MTDENGWKCHEFDADQHPITVHHDWQSGEELAVTVTYAVATAKDVAVNSVGPLSESVNPDALNELFAPQSADDARNWEGCVEFYLDGCKVSADSDGKVVIHSPES